MAGPGRMGRYRLEGPIGAGSFATAHRAVDERLEDTVVVKVLAENHSLNPEIRQRFIAEGRSLRRVRSPHVVTVHDIGESEHHQPYLVLEYADRGTLADRVGTLRAQGWQPSPADIIVVARSLAAAVEGVHAAQLVHRDLSPGNVLLRTVPEHARPELSDSSFGEASVVGPDEQILLADLGMCKDLALNSGLTVSGGTEGFRPPEQRSPGPVDGRADLWALSALMQWLSEGASLPASFGQALHRSLADDPEERHPDVGAWLSDVEGSLAPPESALNPEPAAPRSGRTNSSRWVLGAVLMLVVGLVIGMAVATSNEGPPAGADGASVEIVGPTSAVVGDEVDFDARVNGPKSWVWTLPDGTNVVDAGQVTITARSPGRADVSLRARTNDGRDLEAVHQITVTE